MDTSDSTTLKRCTKCGELRPLDGYHRNRKYKDGRATTCKQCVLANGANQRRVQGIAPRSYYDHDAIERRCTKCGEVKPATTEYFYMRKSGKLDSRCILCQRSTAAEWNANNRDKRAAYWKEYYEENRDIQRERIKNWYKEHQQEAKENARQYRKEHKKQVKDYNKRYRETNREAITQQTRHYRETHRGELATMYRDWAAKNPDRIRASQHRRRARKKEAGGTLTAADLASIRAAQTDKHGRLICWKCGKPIKNNPHLDHWIPLSKGGRNDAGNLHYMHAKCNNEKYTKHPTELGRIL